MAQPKLKDAELRAKLCALGCPFEPEDQRAFIWINGFRAGTSAALAAQTIADHWPLSEGQC